MNNLLKLQDILRDLTYAEMMELASWFANVDKDETQVNDKDFWAYTIHDWAENGEIPGEEAKP
jgi:hypothetical protein